MDADRPAQLQKLCLKSPPPWTLLQAPGWPASCAADVVWTAPFYCSGIFSCCSWFGILPENMPFSSTVESTDAGVQAGVQSQEDAPRSSKMGPSLYWDLDNAKKLQLCHLQRAGVRVPKSMFLGLPVGLISNPHTTLYKFSSASLGDPLWACWQLPSHLLITSMTD